MRVGEHFHHQFPRSALVGGVRVRVRQGDRYGLDPFRPKARSRRSDRVFVEGRNDGSVECGALRNLKDTLRGHRAFRLDPDVRVGHPVHAVPSNLQHVLEPLGHQHSNGRALALQNSIGGYCGAVEDAPNLGIRHAVRVEYAGDAGDEAPGRVVGRGGGLVQPELAGGQIQQHDVGESSSHVDCQGVVIHVCPPSAQAPSPTRLSPRPKCRNTPASPPRAAR